MRLLQQQTPSLACAFITGDAPFGLSVRSVKECNSLHSLRWSERIGETGILSIRGKIGSRGRSLALLIIAPSFAPKERASHRRGVNMSLSAFRSQSVSSTRLLAPRPTLPRSYPAILDPSIPAPLRIAPESLLPDHRQTAADSLHTRSRPSLGYRA